jgi:hypothetical protein
MFGGRNSGEKGLSAHFVSPEDDHAKLRKARAAQIPQSGMWPAHRRHLYCVGHVHETYHEKSFS